MKQIRLIAIIFALVLAATSSHAVVPVNSDSPCWLTKIGAERDACWLEEAIEEAKSCNADSDCAIIFPGCPFGCATALNREKVSDIKRKVNLYEQEYPESVCMQKCPAAPEKSLCVNNICKSVKP